MALTIDLMSMFALIEDLYMTEVNTRIMSHYLMTIEPSDTHDFINQALTDKLLDVYHSQYHHHAQLILSISPIAIPYFLTELAAIYTNDLIYLNLDKLVHDQNYNNILTALINNLMQLATNKPLVIACQYAHYHQLARLLNHASIHLLIITDVRNSISNTMTIEWPLLTKDQNLLLLLKAKCEIEIHHNMTISDEQVINAYHLTNTFYPNQMTFQQTIQLLELASSRAKRQSEQGLPTKLLHTVFSEWTSLPIKSLQRSASATPFHLEGQHLAMNAFGRAVDRNTFIFVGQHNTGKLSAATMLAEHDHSSLAFTFYAAPQAMYESFLELKFKSAQANQYLTAKEIITQYPFAFFILTDIENASDKFLAELEELVVSHSLQHLSFEKATLILTTTVGAEEISMGLSRFHAEESQALSIMQFVRVDENVSDHAIILDALFPVLTASLSSYLPDGILKQLQIIPFVPLSSHHYQRLLSKNLSQLCQRLSIERHVHIDYAPEVISFLLANTSLLSHQTLQTLISTVQTLVTRSLDHIDLFNESKTLYIQLNETGEMLRCDWVGNLAVNS